jgi:MoaA/NifB/PqqE/SkfB family radical SAM enzyme
MHKPANIFINITDRCNLRCRQCNLWNLSRNDERKDLSCQEWINIIKSLKGWLGSYTLQITGGEPFLRKDLVDIIRFCYENGIQTIVGTNATLLTPEDVIALSNFNTLNLNISLDGSTARTHDYLRGVDGSYQKVIYVLRQFKNITKQCRVNVATILMDYNRDEILEIAKLVYKQNLANGIIFQALVQPFGSQYDKNWFKENIFWPKGDAVRKLKAVISELTDLKQCGVPIYNSFEQLRKFHDYFTNPTADIKGHCLSGERNLIIDPRGNVSLCWMMDPIAYFYGKPEQIWDSADAEKQRVLIHKCNRACKLLNCNLRMST